VVDIGTKALKGLNYNPSASDVAFFVFGNVFAAPSVPPGDVLPTPDKVKTYDGKTLTYYGSWTSIDKDTTSLLTTQSGPCNAWAHLFIDVLGAQGVENKNDVYTMASTRLLAANEGMAINQWTSLVVPSPPVSRAPDYTYRNYFAAPLFGRNSFTWVNTPQKPLQLDYTEGMPGQGQPKPAPLFSYHMAVKIGGTIYDPSYGRTWESTADFENQAVGYFAVVVGDSVFFRANDPTVTDLIDVSDDY
jgi:hypothetical protein